MPELSKFIACTQMAWFGHCVLFFCWYELATQLRYEQYGTSFILFVNSVEAVAGILALPNTLYNN